jgi:2-polyprenyl-3-methyl-5-hydroxy-6-metoxy-1,4-benzoquinol methylase
MKKEKSIAKSYNKIAKKYVQEHAYGKHLALKSLKKFAGYLSTGSSILDVGCGGGQDSKYLADIGHVVTGIDVSREMIKLAKAYTSKASFVVADVLRLNVRKNYDGIWCCRVFNHISLKTQDKFLSKLHSLMKNNGILYLTSNVSDKKEDYEAFDSGNDGLLKKRLMPTSFKDLLINHGFTILKFTYWEGKKGMEIIAKKAKS